MQCVRARAYIVECGVGLLDAGRDQALEQHLAICAACAADAAAEAWIAGGLRSLAGEEPATIDVRDRVMAQIAGGAPPDRSTVGVLQLGWATGVAGAAAVGLLLALWLAGPQMGQALQQLAAAGAALAGAAWRVAAVIVPLAAVPLRILAVLADVARAFGGLLDPARPFGIAAVSLAWAAVASTIVIVVGRDLRRGPAPLRSEDR